MPYRCERLLEVTDCEDRLFAQDNINAVRDYAKQRIKGWNPGTAFKRVFGGGYSDQHASNCGWAFETNSVYMAEFERILNETPAGEMWNSRIAAHELLSVLRNPVTKQSVKVTAVRDLNVLFDIVAVDEFGRTRATKKLADFYEHEKIGQVDKSANPPLQPSAPVVAVKRHPEPGTPEALAIEAADV